MPRFRTQAPNPLGKQQATERLRNFIEQITHDYKDHVTQMDSQWNDSTLNFSFTTFGFQIKGELAVGDESVRVEGDLPLAAAMFRKKIEDSITGELEKALS